MCPSRNLRDPYPILASASQRICSLLLGQEQPRGPQENAYKTHAEERVTLELLRLEINLYNNCREKCANVTSLASANR